MTTTTYVYQERAVVLGGWWSDVVFTDERKARKHFYTTPKDGLDARLVKRVTTETILDFVNNDKARR